MSTIHQGVAVRGRVAFALASLKPFRIEGRTNFACCGACGAAELRADYPDAQGYAFYHQQDNEAFREDGSLKEDLHIAFGGIRCTHDALIGKVVEAVLKEHGLAVTWNGNASTRLCVTGAA